MNTPELFSAVAKEVCGEAFVLPAVSETADRNAPLVNVRIEGRRERIVVSSAFNSMPMNAKIARAIHAIILTEIERQRVLGASARFMKFKALAEMLGAEAKHNSRSGWEIVEDCKLVLRIAATLEG